MRKFVLFLSFIIFLFSLSGCDTNETVEETAEETIEEYEYKHSLRCSECSKVVENDFYIETSDADFLCAKCAVLENYRACKSCELYFISDSALDSTSDYCRSCVDDNASGCHLCGAGPLDYDQLVKFTVENEPCYMCVYCCADYFRNVEQMKPCYYCIECGDVFGGTYYLHFVYENTTICGKCIKEYGYKKCTLCKKYYDEGENNICAYCIEKGESD